MWHLIQGRPGCRYAVGHPCVAVVVDALRASATAAMLLDAGAPELLVTREVEEARAARAQWPDALLFGERGGVPPEGFDYGNSPGDAHHAAGRRVIFTTTTGAQWLVAAWGAPAVYMATTVNAQAAAAAATQAAALHGCDVVLIPAGLSSDPAFSAQEDWVAAAVIAHFAEDAGARIGEGAAEYARWRHRIDSLGVAPLFESAPHAEKLRRAGLEADIAYCAQINLTNAVPRAVERIGAGVRVNWGTDY